MRLQVYLQVVIFSFGIFGVAQGAFAAPAVTSVSGTWGHGVTTTVSGSGFDTKATAAPVVWDDASTGTLLTDNGKWSGAWPNRGSDLSYIIQYHAPMRGIALPHNHITRYIAGAHGLSEGPDAGYNVMFWKTINLTSYPFTFYASWYQAMDPAASPLASDWNIKTFDWSYGGNPYSMDSCSHNNWYVAYAPTGVPFTTSISGAQYTLNDDSWGYSGCAGSLQNPDASGRSGVWWDSGKNFLGGWMKMEMEVRMTNQSSGYIKMWEDGQQKIDYVGRTDAWELGNRSIGIGGYSRDRGSNNWRYFADAYLDYTPQRIVLANNSNISNATIKEVQIPTAWTNTSVTFTSNLGQFQPGQTAYLYVIDSTGTANPTGYPVTIGSGVSDTTPPTLPSNFNLAATATSQSNITVSWNPATDDIGIDHYQVERCTGLSCTTFTNVGNPTASPFVDSGLTASTGYSYHVRALDAAGNMSGWSNVVGATTQSPDAQNPTVPTNLSAAAASSSAINLTWTASTDNVGVTGYQVERCSGSSCTTFTQVSTPTTNSYSDTGLVASTTYRYQVRATDAAGNNSSYSSIASATTQQAPPVSASLMLGFNFNEGADTTTQDVSGHNNTGTLSNATWTTSGKYGNAVSFNGSSGAVTVPSFASSSTDATYSYWAYFPNTTQAAYARTFQTGDFSATPTLGISHEINPEGAGSNQIKFVHWSGGHNYDIGTVTLTLNTWHYIAHVVSGDTAVIYVDGIQVLTGSGVRGTGNAAVSIGTGDSSFFNGTIDDLRIYNTALTQAEIQTDMNTPLTSGGSSTSTTCNTVTTTNFSQSAYNSYGAPFDAFQTSTNLLDAKCNSADTHTINLTTGVTGDTTRIVYTKGYYYDPVTASWTQYSGTCNGALNGEWCQGSVSVTITNPNISTASATNPTYLVGMTCSIQQGGSWKCGCRDTTCANFYWQVQGAGM